MKSTELNHLQDKLEAWLGDPADTSNLYSNTTLLALDEAEFYPYVQRQHLIGWGLPRYFVPEEAGGAAESVFNCFALFCIVTGRDPTAAVALFLTSLGFMPVWAAGTLEQKQRYGARALAGAMMAWGLSEDAHGSDILANEMIAEPVPGGYRITGQKNLIGNATHAESIALFARTRNAGGPAGFTLLMFDTAGTEPATYSYLPKRRTVGLRGLEISGIKFNQAFVPLENRIGAEGQGLEIALKASMVARSMVPAIAIGAVEASLRMTLDYARKRVIFGEPVTHLPVSRRALADAFLELITCEAMAMTGLRSLQTVPAQASVHASLVKYHVPTVLERTMSQLAIVLGARYYMRDDPELGIFQKLMRDLPSAGFADGNTLVNLKNLSLQLPGLVDLANTASPELRATAIAAVRQHYDLDATLPAFDPSRIEITSRGLDYELIALPESLELLARAAREDDMLATALRVGRAIAQEGQRLDDTARHLHETLGRERGKARETMELGRRYAWLRAGATLIHLYVHGRGWLAPCWHNPAWLIHGLALVADALKLADCECPAQAAESTFRLMEGLLESGRRLSLFSVTTATMRTSP